MITLFVLAIEFVVVVIVDVVGFMSDSKIRDDIFKYRVY